MGESTTLGTVVFKDRSPFYQEHLSIVHWVWDDEPDAIVLSGFDGREDFTLDLTWEKALEAADMLTKWALRQGDKMPPCEFTDANGTEIYVGPRCVNPEGDSARIVAVSKCDDISGVYLNPDQMRALARSLLYWADVDANGR